VPVALWANVDARLKCERDEVTGRATLKLLHQKNGRSGLVLRFEFEEHAFPIRQGHATSLVARRVHDASDAVPKPAGPKLGDIERIALECLATALVDLAREVPAARDVPRGTRGVRYDQWMATALRYLPPEREEWRRRADFKRAATSLLRKRLVRLVDGWCWLPEAVR
jgi:hypothetical protein